MSMKMLALNGVPLSMHEERAFLTFTEIHRQRELKDEQSRFGSIFQVRHYDEFYLSFVEELRRKVDCSRVDLFAW